MSAEGRRSAQTLESANSEFNRQRFGITQLLKEVHTAMVVQVIKVFPAPPGNAAKNIDGNFGYVHAELVVEQVDNKGRRVEMRPLFNLPYIRIQGNTAALVIDPEEKDYGLAIFCERDISLFKRNLEKCIPESARMFSQSDGIYIGGILNHPARSPKVWVRVRKDGVFIEGNDQNVIVNTTGDTQTNCNNAVINAMSNITISANGTVDINPSGAASVTSTGKSCCAGSCSPGFQDSCSAATPTGKMLCGGSSGSCSPSACTGTMKCSPSPVDELLGKLCVRS